VSGLRLRTGAATDVGRVRPHNEDSLLAAESIAAVADGLGGHAAGEVASGIAVEVLGELAQRGHLARGDVVAAVAEANERILESVDRHPEQLGMGTTVSGVAVVSEPDDSGGSGPLRVAVFNVGDSRVYRFDDGGLAQVTVDHSEVQELVDAGFISRDEAARHPLRNLLTRALGSRELADVDVWVLDPQGGERFLACSDGLTGELEDTEIEQVLRATPDPQEAADQLVRRAVEAGGRDNVTVVVAEVERMADRPS
jgi:protein phosphatase